MILTSIEQARRARLKPWQRLIGARLVKRNGRIEFRAVVQTVH